MAMFRVRLLTAAVSAAAAVILLPSLVLAQSGFAGTVRDTSGAVLPGTTVEAASPVLIEKVRSVSTDAAGQYRIDGLRPGSYVITFTLPGFSTVKRDGIELPADFVATINAELRVGTLEETVTVSGNSPVVDVQTVAKTQVIAREVLDSLPASRTPHALAQLIIGVNLNGADTGGSRAIQQTYMSVHGLNTQQNSQQ